MAASITATPSGLQVQTPYNAQFVSDLKARVPHAARAWQKPYWIVDPTYGKQVADLIEIYFGERVSVPTSTPQSSQETIMIQLTYLGRCKDRGGLSSALGTSDGQSWSYVFPQQVLQDYFSGNSQEEPTNMPTLYAVLGVKSTGDATAIKSAYRRMARQWHPDVCREPDAAEQFQRIQHAYKILSDQNTRKRYDAGLALESSLQRVEQRRRHDYEDDWRAPLRCGNLLVEGRKQVGRFVVNRIIDWQDIVDNRGRTLVSSWDSDNDRIRMEWI